MHVMLAIYMRNTSLHWRSRNLWNDQDNKKSEEQYSQFKSTCNH